MANTQTPAEEFAGGSTALKLYRTWHSGHFFVYNFSDIPFLT